MDPVRNPFAPGAGSQPPELAGREGLIEQAEFAIQRLIHGRHDKAQILLGLRGTGKTVLLNKFEQLADAHGCDTTFIEAPEDRTLASLLVPRLQKVLRALSTVEAAKALAHRALGALKSFAKTFKISYEGVTISVDPAIGVADSGDLESDLTDLFLAVGAAAQPAGRAWVLFIDELQYLERIELSALIVAIHRIVQKGYPVMFFGAGLPQIAALSGEAKSYFERRFDYPPMGALDAVAAARAIRDPIRDEGEDINDAALAHIFEMTSGYPYFLQEGGYQCWNLAQQAPREAASATAATERALGRLDNGFFRVRLERLTRKEKEYVIAMASLGSGPYRSSDVADHLGVEPTSLGPRRAQIIKKGMIYSPSHGDIAFTVPLFEDFLMRQYALNRKG
ncbi:MAG: ATP-binding protein [Pseudomonadota bacterium]|nr:ATP-binding protein [Pseudomonadota bacterium]